MVKRRLFCFLLVQFLAVHLTTAQVEVVGKSGVESTALLFQDQDPLSLELQFSTKYLRKNTNDSTYITSTLSIKNEDSSWDSIKIKLRARGNHRRLNCYYVPLKVKLKKAVTHGTLLEGTSKLKLVLPCLLAKDNDDLVVKEYMAYKLFELISPYHYKTRLANVEFKEEKGKRIKEHNLKAILIEDIDKVAQRHNGRALTQNVHPLQQDDLTSIHNSFFQYLIGNTDFSTRGRHNQKLLFTDQKYVSIPYDFDMSGLVNASYATISGMENMKGSITKVTQRVYKGYKRDENLVEEVRRQYISSKEAMLEVIDNLKVYFQDPSQCEKAKEFVVGFFKILEDDKKFKKYIVDGARTR